MEIDNTNHTQEDDLQKQPLRYHETLDAFSDVIEEHYYECEIDVFRTAVNNPPTEFDITPLRRRDAGTYGPELPFVYTQEEVAMMDSADKYAEVGHDVSKENSFLVFDQNDDPNFYDNLRMLSEKFDQDCFLYKAADEDVAYLIGTNEDFIKDNGERVEAGRLRIGNIDATTYSAIGSGRISFE